MTRISSFLSISLDGCHADADGDMSWAHHMDPEFQSFVQDNSGAGGRLMFGRKTYEMMAGYWPSDMAREQNPAVAQHMNALPKFVFSRTMDKAGWANTRVLKGDLAAEARRLKSEGGPDFAILGSASIVTQLADAGLLDELQIVLNPVTLGDGARYFAGSKRMRQWKQVETRTFGNGCVYLRYVPG
jgi:dihydrofolate reductase